MRLRLIVRTRRPPRPSRCQPALTTCQFDAFTNHYPSGGEDRVIRDAPRSDARVLGHLPMVEVTNADFTESHQEIAQFRVIGFKDGWFLIEGAAIIPKPLSPHLQPARGWVEGKFVTTHLYRDTLKEAPSYSADDVCLSQRHIAGLTDSPVLPTPRL